MKLQQLIENLDTLRVDGSLDQEITALTSDSRQVSEGAMFVAVRGVTVDGHTFIPSLVDK